VGIGGTPHTFAVLVHTDRFHYIRSGHLQTDNLELFAALLQSEQYQIVAVERGFLAPGKTVGADIQHNIENSAMLHATAQHIKRDKMLNYALMWVAYPQWSRLLTGARRAATAREIEFAVKNGVLDLPRTNVHLRDAIGLGMAAYYMARWEAQCTL
jgi:hypothetical protein